MEEGDGAKRLATPTSGRIDGDAMIRKYKKTLKQDPEEDEFGEPPILEPQAEQDDAQPPQPTPHEYLQFEDPRYAEYEYVNENGEPVTENGVPIGHKQDAEQNVVEFNFVDQYNVTCGICQAVVRYDTLFQDHMTNHHPEYADYTLEGMPYGEAMPASGYGYTRRERGHAANYGADPHRPIRSTRTLRRVSQIRVNTADMSIEQLEEALRKKMVEKMGRKIPVTLVDKQHARCGLCNAVVSLNRKFEVIHLVRHFNAWHPSKHKCTGAWLQRATAYEQSESLEGTMKPLSLCDFAVIDGQPGAVDNLQCVWCGMFMDVNSIAMHFHEIHPDEVEVPNCRLCLQELVANSRFMEIFGEDMGIQLPDEHHYKCVRYNLTTRTEKAMDSAIKRAFTRAKNGPSVDDALDDEVGPEEDSVHAVGPEPYANSRQAFG